MKSTSHLTVRKDLQEEGMSVPVRFLDTKEDAHIAQTIVTGKRLVDFIISP